MTILDEVPGALERPGGCRISLIQSADGVTTITLPPRGAPAIVVVACALLLVYLLLIFYMGVMLFFYHKSVLGMTQISPHDLPVSLRPFRLWFMFGWLFMEALGFWALSVLIRPLFLRETLVIGPREIRHERQMPGRRQRASMERQDARGFRLERDPQGLLASVLTLQGRGQEIVIAETMREAEREWLASVGNALLRT